MVFRGKNNTERFISIGQAFRIMTVVIIPFLVSFIFLCFYAKTRLLGHDVYPVGDLAADMLLANQIDTKGYLLTGQYSRFGFHHPGPFFFYLTHLFESIFSSYLPSRAAAWTLAMIFFNSIFLALSAQLAFKKSPQLFSDIIKRVMFVIVIVYYLRNYAISTWPPDKIVIPFMTFLLTLPYIAKRDLRYFPYSILISFILFHGRVDSPIFTFLPLLCVMIFAFLKEKSPLTSSEWRNILGGVIIGFVFLFPILVDISIHRPSNLALIIGSMHQLTIASSSWWDVTKYLVGYWKESIGLIFYPFIVLFIFMGKKMAEDWFNKAIFIVSSLETVIFLIYFKSTPPPLQHYMAEFYLAVPLLIIVRPLINAWKGFPHYYWRRNEPLKIFPYILINILIVVVPVFLAYRMMKLTGSPIWDQNEEIPRMAAEIVRLTKPSHSIRMEHPHTLWPIVSGLLLEFEKEHRRACSTFEGLSFLFTPDMTCGSNRKPNIKLLQAKDCAGKCISIIGDVGLELVRR